MSDTKNLDLLGRRALVCGASEGIGRACAQALWERGADLVLLSRNKVKLQDLADQLRDRAREIGSRASVDVLACDLADTSALENSVRVLSQRLPIHILLHNTGGPPAGALLLAEGEALALAHRTHVLSAHVLAQLLVPGMRKEGYGRIVAILSTSVRTPLPNLGVSNSVRAAMASWAKSLANEVGKDGITVNCVLPGYTQTTRLESLKKSSAQSLQVSEKEVERRWLASVPLGRFAHPREIAEVVAFLASAQASYVSGVSLPVDGGRTPTMG